MENKNGFISTALVYSFLVIYLFLMVSIINIYMKKNFYMEALDDQVAKDIGITKENKSSLLSLILENNVALETNLIDFTKISNEYVKNGNGLYYFEDENKTDENGDGEGRRVYFFRGSVANNYVVFGKQFTRDSDEKIVSSSIKQMCWRILRTNEDGSIRLIYSGIYDESSNKCSSSSALINKLDLSSNEYISITTPYNSLSDDNAYVGYTYASADATSRLDTHHTSQTDSTVKSVLDKFFYENTSLHYTTLLSYEGVNTVDEDIRDTIYCNNRTSRKHDTSTMSDDFHGYAKYDTSYVPEEKQDLITYNCIDPYDKYFLRVPIGNDQETYLDYAVGLPSVSEIIMAGGAVGTDNSSFFLTQDGGSYWTMTPSEFSDNKAKVFLVNENGSIVSTAVDTANVGIRPVISVREDIPVSHGSGAQNEPYMLN